MIGSTLLHYRIDAELGRGGMGIVYRATDTSLDRTVALKILPGSALSNGDDKARFYREAKAAAALNHPNIAQVYQIAEAVPEGGSSDEPRPFIAMEFIDGQSLEERIKTSPLKLKEAVRLATQIAEALKAAHAKGIVHRDIKSANVMLTSEGEAKVLDFGLAKTNQSTQLTRMGSTLGTVAYMSPEQARSEEVDHRTDLWALGVVIYELVAGKNPFGGDYEQAVVYGILNEDPEPLTALRTGVPMELERIADKLLKKDRDRRYQSATDLLADLKGVDIASGSTASRTTVRPASEIMKKQRSNPRWLAPLLFGILMAAFGWMIGRNDTSTSSASFNVLLRIDPLEEVFNTHTNPARKSIALSPNGELLAFQGEDERGSGLFITDLAHDSEIKRLASGWKIDPSFSPDGKWIAFAGSQGIERVSVDGGDPQLVTEAVQDPGGTHWGKDGYIYFIPDYGMGVSRIRPEAGEVEVLFEPDYSLGERGFICVTLHPDEKSVIAGRYGENGLEIVVVEIESGKRTVLAKGMCPAVTDDGQLYFAQGPKLMSAQLMGNKAVSNLTEITARMYTDNGTLSSQHAVSDRGDLIFIEGRSEWGRKLEIRKFDGSKEVLDVGKEAFSEAFISPDGKKLALISPTSTTEDHDLYVYDLDQKDLRRMTTTSSWEGFVSWLSDSQTLVYASERSGEADIYQTTLSGEEELVFADDFQKYPRGVSGDGILVAYHSPTPLEGQNIKVLDRDTGETILLASGPQNQVEPVISPNGRLVAYASNESGNSEIYTIAFPPSGPRVKVSVDGGGRAQFSPSGTSLYFMNGTDLQRIQLDSAGKRIGEPVLVMQNITSFYSILPDESGVIVLESPEQRTVRYISASNLD